MGNNPGFYICPICHASGPPYIAYKNGIPYCRRCISFTGKVADVNYIPNSNIRLKLSYPLSKEQETISNDTRKALEEGHNVLIHAVTGAGKTELVYASMERRLENGKHVGFATPRKDVVVDLVPRIREAFPSAEVTAVYGGHSEKTSGDIIVLTTHQLYRYPSYFDLLVLDEIDAFPFKDNPVLESFFRKSIKGKYILLSATPGEAQIKAVMEDNGILLKLFSRYHRFPLPVPERILSSLPGCYYHCYKQLKSFLDQGKPVFVFSPTIEEGKRLYSFLSLLLKGGTFVSSKEEERRQIIEKFKGKEYRYLVTTSILERGVTVFDLQVIIFHADHVLFDSASLVQISGCVGRKIHAETGKVYFIAEDKTRERERAIHDIEKYNRSLLS